MYALRSVRVMRHVFLDPLMPIVKSNPGIVGTLHSSKNVACPWLLIQISVYVGQACPDSLQIGLVTQQRVAQYAL